MALFVEEIIRTYEEGKIHSSFPPEKVKEIIFTSLCNSNRFNGITKVPYSTLVHSYAVGKLASDFGLIYYNYNQSQRNWAKLFGFMHDMGEVIIGDIVYPMKTGKYEKIAEEYFKIEKAFLMWIGSEIFKIPEFEKKYEFYQKVVKKADHYYGVMELIGISKDCDFFESEKFFEGFKLFDHIPYITLFGFRKAFEDVHELCLTQDKVKENSDEEEKESL